MCAHHVCWRCAMYVDFSHRLSAHTPACGWAVMDMPTSCMLQSLVYRMYNFPWTCSLEAMSWYTAPCSLTCIYVCLSPLSPCRRMRRSRPCPPPPPHPLYPLVHPRGRRLHPCCPPCLPHRHRLLPHHPLRRPSMHSSSSHHLAMEAHRASMSDSWLTSASSSREGEGCMSQRITPARRSICCA